MGADMPGRHVVRHQPRPLVPPRGKKRRMPDAQNLVPAAVRPLVLIVDDYADARALYRHYLTMEGYRVEEASDGREAIETTERVQPDIVLMDLSMPHMDGWEATRRLKANARTARIPVMALTAHAHPAEKARALACGCDAFVTKPCLPQDLAVCIAQLLAQAAAPCQHRV
jgi:two-component system, cell cycle response regulator DivK